jgi:hypothetical protein
MIDNWMKKHLVSNNKCNITTYNAQIFLQGMTKNVRFIFSVGDYIGENRQLVTDEPVDFEK